MDIRPNLLKETPDKSSWYDLWAAAVAVRQQCVLARRAGQADNVGEFFSHDEWALGRMKMYQVDAPRLTRFMHQDPAAI